MPMEKVSLGINDENWQYRMILATHISTMIYIEPRLMTGIPVLKVDFDNAISDVFAKGAACLHVTGPTTAIRDTADKVLSAMMNKLADWVNLKSGGEATIILLSGFSVAGKGTRGKIGPLSAKQGEMPGQVILSWEKMGNACSYMVQFCLNEDGKRETFTYGGSKGRTGAVINGLVRGKEYLFYMKVIYSTYEGAWLEPVTFMVT